MNVILRCDSSLEIGSGHAMRCLVLAKYLQELGHQGVFVSKSQTQQVSRLIEVSGFKIIYIDQSLSGEQDAESTVEVIQKYLAKVCVVDNYLLDFEFEHKINQYCRVVAIDDLANRKHACDVLIDANFSLDPNRYKDLVPPTCLQLLGPRYAFLKKDFIQKRGISNFTSTRLEYLRSAKKHRFFTFFGGTDPSGESFRLFEALEASDLKCDWTIVITKSNPDVHKFSCKGKSPKIHVLVEPSSLAEEMLNHTVYFGSGGTITWERMSMGLGGFVATVADNQKPAISSLAKQQLAIDLGEAQLLDYKKTINELESFVTHKYEIIINQSALGMKLVEGLRVSDLIQVLGENS